MERADVERAVQLAGLELPADADYQILGQDPILTSPHYLGTGAASHRRRSRRCDPGSPRCTIRYQGRNGDSTVTGKLPAAAQAGCS